MITVLLGCEKRMKIFIFAHYFQDSTTTTIRTTTPGKYVHPTWRPRRLNCSPPAIEQFPRPIMGPSVRKHGGLVIHILVAVYTFFGLAIVCDDYFVASLDRICEGTRDAS